ncbi:MAG: hypothetical protein KGS45_07815 [Planctomycetes bacterium]|nr:hypothetical protein [Planctomycetota bacterium]
MSHAKSQLSLKTLMWSAAVGCGVALPATMWLASCQSQRQLVEVFDNGPVGGPSGPSEGFIWVGKGDRPPPGKSYRPTDPATLTPEQKNCIR